MSQKFSPCLSHPCECTGCVFSPLPEQVESGASVPTVMSEADYGCVHGGSVVKIGTQLGLLRRDGFRPVTLAGAQFMAETSNPLLAYV